MKLIGGLVFVTIFTTCAVGSPIVIDDFTCTDAVTLTGLGTTSGMVSPCAGSIGGSRSDLIFITDFTGSITTAENSVSTIDSNPPAGAITGTIGTDLIGQNVLTWFGSTTPGVLALPNLNLTGDSMLVEIESDTGGTLTVNLASGPTNSSNRLSYSATFGASPTFEELLIPLINPTVVGSGANVGDVTGIGMTVGVPGGGTWTIDGVEAVPEPFLLVPMGVGVLGLLIGSLWRAGKERR